MNITINGSSAKQPTFTPGELVVLKTEPELIVLVTARPQWSERGAEQDQFWGIRMSPQPTFRCEGNWHKDLFAFFHGTVTLEQP